MRQYLEYLFLLSLADGLVMDGFWMGQALDSPNILNNVLNPGLKILPCFEAFESNTFFD